MSERHFKGIWIPASIWLELDLTAAERCLWAEIDSFTNANSGYYKTNEQAAEELGISTRQVSRCFAKLESMGCIVVYKNGVRRVAKSLLNAHGHSGEDRHSGEDSRHSGEDTSHHVQDTLPHSLPIKNKKKNIHSTVKTQPLVMPFEEDEFKRVWAIWIKERRDRKYKKLTPLGEQQMLNRLNKISHGDYKRAIRIIEQSIEQSWQGLFPIRENRTTERAKLDAERAHRWASQ